MFKATACNTCGHNRLQVLDKNDGYSLVTPLTPHIGEFIPVDKWDVYVVSCSRCHAVETLWAYYVTSQQERRRDDGYQDRPSDDLHRR